MSGSLWFHGLQHARVPCPSPTPRACSNSCPLSGWCHPTISSSIVLFSSCLPSFWETWSFPKSQFFASGGQNIGASVSALVHPKNIQDCFPLGLTGLMSLQFKGLWKVFSQQHSSKASILWCSVFFMANTYIHTWLLGKKKNNIASTRWTFLGKVMSLLFNMLFRLIIAFLPRSNCLLI